MVRPAVRRRYRAGSSVPEGCTYVYRRCPRVPTPVVIPPTDL